MDSLGNLSPVESARAKLQEQIGNFLQGRARLNRLMKHSSLTIQGKAQGLYAVQTALEDKLQNDITPKIQAMSSGSWGISGVLEVGGFTGMIAKQVVDVGKLEKEAGISGPVASVTETGIDTTTIAIGGGAVLLAGLFIGKWFGKKK